MKKTCRALKRLPDGYKREAGTRQLVAYIRDKKKKKKKKK
jgi:hypothetical protein